MANGNVVQVPGPTEILADVLADASAVTYFTARNPTAEAGGRIEEQGAPGELFGNPQRERTQQFLSAVKSAD